MIDGRLTLWHIFTHPADLPHVPFVVRVDVVEGMTVLDTGERWLRKTLDQAREVVRANDPSACVRLAPSEGDVPCLVETWV